MQIVNLTDAGDAPYEVLLQFGGSYRFFEKLRRGGIGSPKWIYLSGIDAFDNIQQGRGTDTCYVNGEWLRDGILFRLNKVQRLKGLITSFDSIEKITLENRVINEGTKLSVYFYNGKNLELEIPQNSVKSTLRFFNAGPLPIIRLY